MRLNTSLGSIGEVDRHDSDVSLSFVCKGSTRGVACKNWINHFPFIDSRRSCWSSRVHGLLEFTSSGSRFNNCVQPFRSPQAFKNPFRNFYGYRRRHNSKWFNWFSVQSTPFCLEDHAYRPCFFASGCYCYSFYFISFIMVPISDSLFDLTRIGNFESWLTVRNITFSLVAAAFKNSLNMGLSSRTVATDAAIGRRITILLYFDSV